MTNKRYEPVVMTPVATSEMEDIDVVSGDPPALDHILPHHAPEIQSSHEPLVVEQGAEVDDDLEENEDDIVVDDDERPPPLRVSHLDLRSQLKLTTFHKGRWK